MRLVSVIVSLFSDTASLQYYHEQVRKISNTTLFAHSLLLSENNLNPAATGYD